MTVEQLISNLQEFPQDAEVVISEFNSYRGEDVEKDPKPDYYPHQNRVFIVMDKVALKLQERLIQTCIDFINEHKDDEQVKEIYSVEFSIDDLQESVKHGSWQPCTDSCCALYGTKPSSIDPDLCEGYLIDESY